MPEMSGGAPLSLTDGTQKTQIVDGSGNVVASSSNRLSVGVQMVDENGVLYGVKHVQNKPRVSAMTYLQDIGEGNIANHTPWTKIGYTPTLNTTDSDIWSAAGVYSFSTSAAKWEVVSSDNTQDIGTVIKGDAVGDTVTSDAGGSLTTLVDADVDFTGATAVAIGDCVILDPHGTTPEWGFVTTVAAHTLTCAGGFSHGGTGASRKYAVVDASAKTGAQVIEFDYLTTAFAEKSEIVVLNGTTVVDTVNTDCYRVNAFRVIAAGSGAKPVGNLTIRIDGGGATKSYIIAGFTRARNIIYTVPAGKVLFVTQFSAAYATTGNANKEYGRLYTRANLAPGTQFSSGNIFYPFTEILTQNSTVIVHIECPTKLPAGTDIKVSGIASATGVASCVLRGWLENA